LDGRPRRVVFRNRPEDERLMATEVVCPDCNKYIAAKGEVDETVRCHCGDDFSYSGTKP